jgi:(E)-4-hydroxy-3-methylbut-2-enyl-diphosphate synthase
MFYCSSLTRYQRRKTRRVYVGNIPLGGEYPVRLQSMTNTATRDIEKTAQQCIQIFNAGADFVRITAPGLKDAEILKDIRTYLREKGYHAPLVADIHYSAKAAEVAAAHVEKVRINPGNYADKRQNKTNFTAIEYQQDIQKIEMRIAPLLEICKKHCTAIRIGVNHGSLSDRIMDKYGNTPEGMAASAMEFLRICKKLEFHNVVVSMKASNTRIMVYANRLLLTLMNEEGMNYPLHLGVTEAGEGEDGRIKSAVGIGALLADGIGETIRVSLTEAPENEIPVARKLVQHFTSYLNHHEIPNIDSYPVHPYQYFRRATIPVNNIGGENVPVVIGYLRDAFDDFSDVVKEFGWFYNKMTSTWKFNDHAADYLYLENVSMAPAIPDHKGFIVPYDQWLQGEGYPKNIYPVLDLSEYVKLKYPVKKLHFVNVSLPDLFTETFKKMEIDPSVVFICHTSNQYAVGELRRIVVELMNQNISSPVIFAREYQENDLEDFQLKSAAETGALLIDGLGDGILLINNNLDINKSKINETAFGILQAARMRISKTEFISCPGCGRTLFNLEDTVASVRAKTSHLKGLKIAVMGCIVNGPGEMADADYGYVGSGKGMITLYKNRQVIKKNIPENNAIDE